jgi:hypothetical protein
MASGRSGNASIPDMASPSATKDLLNQTQASSVVPMHAYLDAPIQDRIVAEVKRALTA